jgi:anti-sigma factor (TIGR02949 family)
MTDCGCEKAKKDLEEYLRNELCREDAADIREHLDNCDGCTHEAHLNVVLTEVVQRACKETAPETLRTEVLLRIRSFQATAH